ncbi:uncharacterized protein A1O5_02190 [Cladophialophora psammophila CBS 110553]|uniref:Uncharacterized protein n=1 Tax=Cladophialophora psammophila CBS 110553 TaxID=1182543 RepID=W9XZ09_9EURO|nr:uncharacterized protein A1O5_02190 [Cladophialophora psammophila CBS 110553]EXJ75494.1 hypothetical protein A1O5_02190 [Cladophialophora psammophila CBS 110553]
MVQPCAPLDDLVSNGLGTMAQGFQKTFQHTAITAELTGQSDMTPKQLDAIGIQCRSTSKTGTATIDGRTRTYAYLTYQEADAIPSGTVVPLAIAIPRLFRSEVSAALADTLAGSNMDLNPMAYVASIVSWLQNLYRPADAFHPQPIYCDAEENVDVSATSTWQQLQLLNSTQFLTSMLRAHQEYALEMSRPPPTGLDRTAAFTGNVSTVPAPPVLALLALWALACAVLGATYARRRRWSETLDGFSMFRFSAASGLGYTDTVAFSGDVVQSTRHFRECRVEGAAGVCG